MVWPFSNFGEEGEELSACMWLFAWNKGNRGPQTQILQASGNTWCNLWFPGHSALGQKARKSGQMVNNNSVSLVIEMRPRDGGRGHCSSWSGSRVAFKVILWKHCSLLCDICLPLLHGLGIVPKPITPLIIAAASSYGFWKSVGQIRLPVRGKGIDCWPPRPSRVSIVLLDYLPRAPLMDMDVHWMSPTHGYEWHTVLILLPFSL